MRNLEQALTAVAGMGGVGKTELAIQYARQHEADYPGGICWLSARESDLAALIVQFAQLHMNLEVPQQDFGGNPRSLTEQVEWCWENWQPPEGLVLIVLDDVTDVGNYQQLLPKTNRFRVLMTTRLRNLVVCQPKMDGLGQAGEAGEAGGERDFSWCC